MFLPIKHENLPTRIYEDTKQKIVFDVFLEFNNKNKTYLKKITKEVEAEMKKIIHKLFYSDNILFTTESEEYKAPSTHPGLCDNVSLAI